METREGHRNSLSPVGFPRRQTPRSSEPRALPSSRHLPCPEKAFLRTPSERAGTLSQQGSFVSLLSRIFPSPSQPHSLGHIQSDHLPSPHPASGRKTESSSKRCLGLAEIPLHLERIDSFLGTLPPCCFLQAKVVSCLLKRGEAGRNHRENPIPVLPMTNGGPRQRTYQSLHRSEEVKWARMLTESVIPVVAFLL